MEKPNKCIEKYGQMFSSFSQAFSMPKVVWKIKVLKKGITLNMPWGIKHVSLNISHRGCFKEFHIGAPHSILIHIGSID